MAGMISLDPLHSGNSQLTLTDFTNWPYDVSPTPPVVPGMRWTPTSHGERIIGVPIATISDRDEHGRSAGRPRPSRAARLSKLMLLAIGAYCSSNPAVWAQTSDSQTGDANKSWSATTESQSDNVVPHAP